MANEGDFFDRVTSNAAAPQPPAPELVTVETADGFSHEFVVEGGPQAALYKAIRITENGFTSTPDNLRTLAVVYPPHSIQRVVLNGSAAYTNTQVVTRRRSH